MRSLWPILAAVVVVAAVGFARRAPAAAAPASREPAGVESRPVLPVVVGEPAQAAARPAAPMEPAEEARLPAPPREAVERTEALQDWLVTLPTTDLARLAGTTQMDGYVSRVVSHLQATAKAGPDGMQELDQFLRRLNAAILEAKGTHERR